MDIVEKIQNLLRLSKSSNMNEAALAAAKAKELADKYNIALEILKDKQEIKIVDEIIDWVEEQGCGFWKPNLEVWEILLAKTIAESNGCRVLTVEIDNGYQLEYVLNIVGRPQDIEITQNLIVWLHTQILSLILKDASGKPEEWRASYTLGAVRKVDERLSSTKIETEKEMIKSLGEGAKTAIIQLDNRLNRVDHFLNENLEIESGQKQKAEDLSGFRKGYIAADNLHLTDEKKLANEERKKFLKKG